MRTFNRDRGEVAAATKSRNEFIETFKKVLVMKQNMLKKGLKKAQAKCPYCDGFWMATLSGPKNHIHMYCTKCEVRAME